MTYEKFGLARVAYLLLCWLLGGVASRCLNATLQICNMHDRSAQVSFPVAWQRFLSYGPGSVKSRSDAMTCKRPGPARAACLLAMLAARGVASRCLNATLQICNMHDRSAQVSFPVAWQRFLSYGLGSVVKSRSRAVTCKNFGLAGVVYLLAILGAGGVAGETLKKDPGKTITRKGNNTLTLEGFSLKSLYEGAGSDEDEIQVNDILILKNMEVFSDLEFFRGADMLYGNAKIHGVVRMGDGNDHIGNFTLTANADDNKLAFFEHVYLGNGENKIKALKVADVTGGVGDDSVHLTRLANDDSTGRGGDIDLMDGKNMVTAYSITSYRGGNGIDDIDIDQNVTSTIRLGGGTGNNTLNVTGKINGLVSSEAGGTTVDWVSIGGGKGNMRLGNGVNNLKISGNWSGAYTGGSGVDTITIKAGVTVSGGSGWTLADGNDVVKGAGTISTGIDFGAGNDVIGQNPANLTSTQKLEKNSPTISGAIQLGSGSNKVYAKTISKGGSITGGNGRDDVFISGGEGNIDLKGGSNTLTLSGNWSGKYTGGSASDTITIGSGTTVSSTTKWSLDDGDDVVKGAGTISTGIDFGGGSDTIGQNPNDLTDSQKLKVNSLTISGAMQLGSGANEVYAKTISKSGSITGGSGSDDVSIAGGGGNIDLKGGSNTLTLSGNWSGKYSGGSTSDVITIDSGVTVSSTNGWRLADGDDVVKGAGTISTRVDFGEGNDIIGQNPTGLNSAQKLKANSLTISGEIQLGSGANEVYAKTISKSGSITGGSGSDDVSIAGGEGNIDLKGGSNTLTLSGNWSGKYTGGSVSDIITIGSGVTVSSTKGWRLADGDDVVKGAGTISTEIDFGAGNDDIGQNPADLNSSQKLKANFLTISAEVQLGSGENKVYAKTISKNGSITGGSDSDIIFIVDGDGNIDLGSGSNSLTVSGSWTGDYTGGSDSDIVKITAESSVSGHLKPGDGFTRIFGSGNVSDITMGNGISYIGKYDEEFKNDLKGMLEKPENGLSLSGRLVFGSSHNLVLAKEITNTGFVLGSSTSTYDGIALSGNANTHIDMGGGEGTKQIVLHGTIANGITSKGIGLDHIDIGGGKGDIDLGNGDNVLIIRGDWKGNYFGGTGTDHLTLKGNVTGNIYMDGKPGSSSQVASGTAGLSKISGANTPGVDKGSTDVSLLPSTKSTHGGAQLKISNFGSRLSNSIVVSGNLLGHINMLGSRGGYSLTVKGNIEKSGGAFAFARTAAGQKRYSVTGGAGSDDVHIGGGNGNVNLGGGKNSLTLLGNWGGEYSGLDGDDIINVGSHRIINSPEWSLGGGANLIKGSGFVSAGVTFGNGNDRIGGVSDVEADNSLFLSGLVNLGGGKNIVRARGVTSLTAGSGDDSVYIKPRAGFDLSTLNLGAGANNVWIIGSAGDPSPRRVTISMSSGQSSNALEDSLFICGETFASSGCGSLPGQSHAFNVVLDARGGNIWETVKIGNEESTQRSFLTVRGNLILKNPEFNNLAVIGDGVAGDVISVTGSYKIAEPSMDGSSGTVFELDVQAKTGKLASDILKFGAAKASDGYSKVPVIKARQVSNERTSTPLATARLKVVTIATKSDIQSVSLLGGQTNLNGHWWRLGDPVVKNNETVYFLEPVLDAQVSPEQNEAAIEHVAGSTAGAVASWSTALQSHTNPTGHTGTVVSRSKHGSSGIPFWSSFTMGKQRQGGAKSASYNQSIHLMTSGMELFSRDVSYGQVSHQITMLYGKITSSGHFLDSKMTGFGYGVDFQTHQQSRFSFRVGANRTASDGWADEGKGFTSSIYGLVMSVEAGQDIRLDENLGLTVVGRLVQSHFAGKAPVDKGALVNYKKLSGDVGFGFNYVRDSLSPFGQLEGGLSEVYGMVSMTQDLEVSLDMVGIDDLDPHQVHQTWINLEFGWGLDFGNGEFGAKLSTSETIGGEIEVDKTSLTLAYGLSW